MPDYESSDKTRLHPKESNCNKVAPTANSDQKNQSKNQQISRSANRPIISSMPRTTSRMSLVTVAATMVLVVGLNHHEACANVAQQVRQGLETELRDDDQLSLANNNNSNNNKCTDSPIVRINVTTTDDHNHHHHHHHQQTNKPLTTSAFNKKSPIKEQIGGKFYLNNDDFHLTTNDMQAQQRQHHVDQISMSDLTFESISRAHSMRTYHLDISSYRRSARTIGDAAYIDNNNADHVRLCQRHLSYYANLLQTVKNANLTQRLSRQALVLADSYARPESGLAMGNSFWLGQYTQCLALKLDSKQFESAIAGNENNNKIDTDTNTNTNTNSHIDSQYCIVSSHAPDWNRKDTLNTIRLGVCLPESCSNSMLEDHFKQQVFTMASTHLRQPFNELEMTGIFCLPHPSSQVRQFTWSSIGFMVVMGAFVATCAIATVIDNSSIREAPGGSCSANQLVRNWKVILIEGFSLTRNYAKLSQVNERRDNSNPLDSLAGIKVLSLFWIIGAHSMLLSPTASNNLIYMDTLTQTYLANFYLSAHLVVDTFFAASGLLASYLLFKGDIRVMNTTKWIVATVHRYWRLTPLYLLAIWYAKSMGSLMGSGPYWDYMTSERSPRLQCNQESWLVALLHLCDFKSPKDHCVPFAWFIANGMKFWLVTPLFVTLIARSRLKGYILTGTVLIGNIVLVFLLTLKSSVDMEAVIDFRPESADNVLNNMGEIYSRPYSRIGTYLIGLVAGHLLYLMETKQIEMRFSEKANKIIWTLVTITLILLTFVVKFAQAMPKDHIVYVFSISSALIRPMWATCTCWLILAMAQGQAAWLRRFLSSRVWVVLVRLSYSAYLVQGEMLALIIFVHHSSPSVKYLDMITNAIVAICLTLAVSFITSLLVEFPLVSLEEFILPKRRGDNNRCRPEQQQEHKGPQLTDSAPYNKEKHL